MQLRKVRLVLIFGIVVLVATGCGLKWQQPFPDAELVYQVDPASEYSLGFIDADQSNLTLLVVGDYFSKPVWSVDGSLIYGLTRTHAYDIGYPSYWEHDGKFKQCNDWGYLSYVTWSGNEDNLKEVITYDAQSIMVVDLESCEKTKILVDYWEIETDIPVNGVEGISLSPDHEELLFSIEVWDYAENTHEYPIYKLNLRTGQKDKLAEGVSPAWSPDGSQIAYVQTDGIYVMKADGSMPQKLIDHYFGDQHYGNFGLVIPKPNWSPDGNWIVYHRCDDYDCMFGENSIYKINVNGREEYLIVSGAEYPSWKP